MHKEEKLGLAVDADPFPRVPRRHTSQLAEVLESARGHLRGPGLPAFRPGLGRAERDRIFKAAARLWAR